ncbi:hypothetical protein R5R35_001242 [Gryllus longicercus]|uniref:Mitogen-activated protein kinase-binding protein 1 n=1 Tax=Gryllus longicercus TaxID=2509291 RepID=A0AAN9V9I7_9ORTH
MQAPKSLVNGARDKENTPAYEVKLERVIGLTVTSNAALDCDPNSEVVAYPAGCTVVLFNPRKGRQHHLLNSSRKTITSVAFSADGRYLATGECGHLPSVRVWDLAPSAAEPGSPATAPAAQQVAEFAGHKYGINCVAFSPSHKYVVSVGSQHDMIVNVWDWRANIKVASNKVSTKVKAVSFAESGNYFVTVGNRHVKFWYLEYSRSAKYKDTVPLMGRSAILGEQRNNYFCDVACGRGDKRDSTYAITKSGLLCEFNNRRLLDKWVELRTTSANCMTVGENLIFIGCAEGIIRCFNPATLQFITTLPRTHYLGVDVSQGLSISHMATHPPNAKYPDAVALAYDPVNCKLTCVYNDHSLYIWDVRDIKRVGKAHSFLFHSACIWGVDIYPVLDAETSSATAPKPAMPPGSFVTCSSDDTIRVWNLDSNLPVIPDSMYNRNIYSSELLKVLYVDPELTYLKDLDLSAAGASEKTDTSYDGRNGVRSIRVSPDGQHLASGDRAGNIRIHSLRDLQEICRIEAHDAEVLCLEYSRPESGKRLLASASRDRLIHVFSVDEDYNFQQTLDDHSSSITAVRFLHAHEQLQMVSCGADKSIIFRQLQMTPGGSQSQFSRGHNVAGKTTLYDMEVDSGQKHILTACQDRNIRVYNVNSGKHSKTFKGSVGEDGSLIKVVLDNSGIYAATSCTDKTLCVYDYYSGECMATMFGHSELVTGLRFTSDCRRLISASGDGCIFVWKVPHDMVITMHARLSQQAARAGRRPVAIPNGLHLDNETFGPPPSEMLDPNANSMLDAAGTDYRFTMGPLPLWAKKQMTENSTSVPPHPLSSRQQLDPPRGRWAQRLDAGGITVKSVYDSDSIIPIPLTQDKRTDSEGSKDSSIDSGTELRSHYTDFRQETIIVSKQDMESTEHDGDVEDYSEGEGESTEPEQIQRLIYYPPAEETGSDYTVNAMDVEELRRSQRRHKKGHVSERLLDVVSVSASVSGSQDSDDDDEDGSTPSADTADRTILSMLSVSTESLDRVGKREKYLKNTFESLSGAEQDVERGSKDAGGTSISSQFLVRASLGSSPLSKPPVRNVAVINAAKQARSDNETSKKREELQRRIEETRRKLQSVGYRSNLKGSQSISDLSHIPEKDGRNGLRAATSNHAHRYTSAGGKQYATIIRHRMSITLQSELSKPLSLPLGHGLKAEGHALTETPQQLALPPTENSPISNYNSLPVSALKDSSDTTLNGKRSNIAHNPLLTQTDVPQPKYNPPAFSNLTFTKPSKMKNLPVVSSSISRSLVPSSYHTLPIVKKGAKPLSLLEGVPSTDMSRLSLLPSSRANCPIPPQDDNAWVAESCSNNALGSSVSTAATNTSNVKALNAGRSNIISSITDSRNRAQTRIMSSPTRRPVFLNLRSNSSSNKYRQMRCSKPPLTNQSLPESPVCEELKSPTMLFQNLTDTESGIKSSSRFSQTRRSCSYFIDLNTLADDEFPTKKDGNNVTKSSESLPATLSRANASSDENLLDSCNEDDEVDGNFSSDSLEEPSEFSSRVPRRCVSDYQIFNQRPHGSRSQENILSGNTSHNNSGDILEMCARLEQDRHSSASFFLSLQRRDPDTCRSQESILTDDSECHIDRDTCRSTESILESDYHFSSSRHARHRDSYQSTESILTDDSDCQVFGSSQKIIECGFVNKGFNMGTSPSCNEAVKFFRSPIQSTSEYYISDSRHTSANKETSQEASSEQQNSDSNQHRTIFRTRSLQDTTSKVSSMESGSCATAIKQLDTSRPPTPSKIGLNCASNTYRKSSYPRSRPQTPTLMPLQFPGVENYSSFGKVSQESGLQDNTSTIPGKQMNERPPTAPKPTGKVTHKPPPKPRQKPTCQQMRQRGQWGRYGDGNGSSPTGKNMHGIVSSTSSKEGSGDKKKNAEMQETSGSCVEKLSIFPNKGKTNDDKHPSKNIDESPSVGVKLLCKSFENVLDDYDMSDECIADLEEDSFPVAGGGSGSSTPATSSSAANSPKRAWPPASRAPGQRPLAKRLVARQPVLPSKCCPVSGKVGNKGNNATRTLPRHSSKQSLAVNSNMTRSTSMGMLNQSDSESDLSLQRPNGNAGNMSSRMNGLMRPTISSQNKINNQVHNKNTTNGSQARRRGLQPAYSSVNLSQVGNEDSSSEETSGVTGKANMRPRSTSIDRTNGCAPSSLPTNSGQPQAPPRRGASSSLHGRYGSERDLSRSAREVTQRLTAGGRATSAGSKPIPPARHNQLEPSPQELPVKDTDRPIIDVASAPLSQQLCSSLADQLTRAADSVVQLYKRLALEGEQQVDQSAMLRGLEEAASEAQRTLRLVATNSGQFCDTSQPDPQLASKLQDLMAVGQAAVPGDQANVMSMMQQYTDVLINLVQQRMGSGPQNPS